MDDNEKIQQVHNIYVKWAKAHGHDPENKKVFDAFSYYFADIIYIT